MSLQSIATACAALAGIIILVLLTGQAAKRTRFARTATARMRVEDSLALDTRRRLVLVSCDGRLVLLLTGVQDQVVGWLPERAS